MEWKIIFEVDVVATRSLYLLHIYWFLSLLIFFFLVGSVLWFIVHRCMKRHGKIPFVCFNTRGLDASIVILTSLLILLLYIQPQPYTNLSSNMVVTFFSEIAEYYGRPPLSIPLSTETSALDIAVRAMRAPVVDISRPLVTLKKPIKHVFLVVLESIRADVLPLDENFAKTIGSTFLSNTTADSVTPFLSSLRKNSVHTVATTTASYTFKSLLSILCGIYPLNKNFLVEISSNNILYQRCLPELMRQMFRTANNRSVFRSGFFTAAQGDFDHQEELSQKFDFDYTIDGDDIHTQLGRRIPKLGYFGPPDPYVLPLMWNWIDKTLAEKETSQLFTSLVLTGTHEPFQMPRDRPMDQYRQYIKQDYVNRYLNVLAISDELLKEVIDGFKSRHLYNETLFVIVSDHGFVFNDHGRNMLGNYNIPLESAFLVPLMFHNPHLEAKQLHGQFTNMDILPTVMDILLSSKKTARQATNQLLSVPRNELQLIMSRYEGTSILRMPVKQQSVRYTFHLANPGNSFVTVKQYPRKLTYEVAKDKVRLYHLTYDPFEFTDLIALDNDLARDDNTTTYASWLEVKRDKHTVRTWQGRWIPGNKNTTNHSQKLLQKQKLASISNPNGKVQLSDMLDWAEQTLELARFWKDIVKQRYQGDGSETLNKS